MNAWAQTTYEIGNADDLVAFAEAVNGGETDANAVLTNDIDMTGVAWNTPIGDWNTGAVTSAYKGHFDGQGHTISGLTYTTKMNYHGLFGVVSTGCLIENFTIYGTITSSVATSGVVGYARDATPTIRNVHSYQNINNTRAGSRLGGILGSSVNGTIVVENCTYSGTLDGNDAGGNGNYGGIVGYVNNNSAAHLRVTNCLFDGELKNTAGTPGNCTFGGMVGYVGASPDVTIKNCLSLGYLQSKVTGLFYGAVKNAACSIINSYYQKQDDAYTINGSSSTVTPTTQQVTEVDDAQLSSGEVCYLLNESVSGGTNWYQTLIDDEYPTPNGSDKVYANGSYKCDGVTPKENTDVTYSNSEESNIDPHTPANGVCSVCGIITDENYMTPNDEDYYEIGTPDQLKWFAAYVNQVDHAANAVLTADLDMTGVEVAIIGNSPANAFKGTFDGQGHEINNYSLTYNGTLTKSYGYGMFGNTNGATIKIFTIDGSMTFNGTSPGDLGCALVGWPDGGTLIQNIKSSINIDSHVYSHIGGIVGSLRTATIDRCEYAGHLNGYASGNGVAGIAGYTNYGTITNCIFSGSVEGTGTGYYTGILGYVNNTNATMKNCLSYGTATNDNSSYVGALVARLNNIGTYSNNYYVGTKGIGGGNSATNETFVSNTIKITTEQLANGEACYLLNGDQSEIVFFQTLPDDEVPTLDATHGTVYQNGYVCPNGHPQDGVTYNNTSGSSSIRPHNYVDGFCAYCETLDEDYIIPNSDDFLEIGTPAQFKWFAVYANQVEPASNALLTADIDLTGFDRAPIGNASVAYTGTFDGQGHHIINFTGTTDATVGKYGLFGNIAGATIKNFSIAGTLTVPDGAANGSGVVGWATSSTISNIYSTLVIEVGGNNAKHVGGVVGSAQSGANTITNCTFAGSLTVGAGSHDCFAGIAGYISSDVVTNCANYGTIDYYTEGGYVGGIVGYINNASPTIANCLGVGAVTYKGEGTASYGGAIIGRHRKDAAKVQNNYWLEGSAKAASSDKVLTAPAATSVTAEQLASGEVTAKLGIAFRQNIGTDTYPVLDPTHNVVAEITAAGYATLYVPDTDVTIPTGVEAYTGVIKNEGWLHLNDVSDAIAADEAVVLAGEAGIYSFVPTTGATKAAENDLKGAAEDIAITEVSNKYILAKPGENPVGFYKTTSGFIKAGKAYLEAGSEVKGFIFKFDDDATGIAEIENGKLNAESSIYNVAGQKLAKMQKGINIVGGKKVLK